MRRINYGNIFLAFGVLISFAPCLYAQVAAGGAYSLEQVVLPTGGGSSTGNNFAVVGTAGQALAGTNSTGGGLAARGGFWQPNFSPTAAPVSISGRVLGPFGAPIDKARVILQESLSAISRTVLTSPFGYFQFDDIDVGRIYVLSVSSKRYSVEPVTVFVQGDMTELVLIAAP